MKKTHAALCLLFTISITIFTLAPFVSGQGTSDYTIEKVNRKVELKYGVYIFIYDTFSLKGSGTIDSFYVGLPYEYKENLLYCYAYEPSNPLEIWETEFSDTAIHAPGLRWIKIHFPSAVELSSENPYNFTMVSILKNAIYEEKINITRKFTLDFPPYPGLTKKAELFEGSVILPLKINITAKSEAFSEASVSNTSSNTIMDYTVENLEAFTYTPGLITFVTLETMQRIVLHELEREVSFDAAGNVKVSDAYYITNKGLDEVKSVDIAFPRNSSDLVAWDEFGKPTVKPTLKDEEQNIYSVQMEPPLQPNDSRRFRVSYTLPKEIYVEQKGTLEFSFNMTFFENANLLAEKFSVTVVLPEGAQMLDVESTAFDYSSVHRKVFSDSVSYTFNSPATMLNKPKISLAYRYNLLWVSFRPILWIGAALALTYVVALIWQRRKLKPAVVAPMVGVSVEVLRRFVDAYEEKKRVSSELEALKVSVEKGKIPRRRYKIRRRTLENRLSTLNKRIATLKEQLRRSGARYADAIGQLEVAETELETVEVDIQRIEARYRRGEVSRSAYRKLLDEYRKRKEKALLTIDGLLLRFKEEL